MLGEKRLEDAVDHITAGQRVELDDRLRLLERAAPAAGAEEEAVGHVAYVSSTVGLSGDVSSSQAPTAATASASSNTPSNVVRSRIAHRARR